MAITPCTWAIPRVPRTSQQLEHFTSGPSSTTAFFGGGPQHRTFCNPPLRRVLLCFFASLLLCFFASLPPCPFLHELQNPLLRPKPLRPAPPRYEPAMPAMLRRYKLHPRILRHPRPQERFVRHKGIILRGNQQCRHSHFPNHFLRPRCLVILFRILISEMRRGDRIVEFPHRPDRSKSVPRVPLRK